MSLGIYIGGAVGAIVGGVIGWFAGGPYGAAYGASVGFSIGAGIGGLIDPIAAPPPPSGTTTVPFEAPSAEEQAPVPELLGIGKVSGNIVDFFNNTSRKAKNNGIVIGYVYSLSWVVVLCSGPVDALYSIFSAEKLLWSGEYLRGNESYITLNIDKFGTIRFYWGTETQVVDPVIEAACVARGKIAPTYRGYCYALMIQCGLGNTNRAPFLHFVTSRCPLLGVAEDVTKIACVEYNPALAIYYILRNLRGFSLERFDVNTFINCAAELYEEQFGVNLYLSVYEEAMSYMTTILTHIDAALIYDTDSKFKLRLLRGTDAVNDMILIDENMVLDKPTIDRSVWPETINQFKVMYPKRVGVITCIDCSEYFEYSDGSLLSVSKFSSPGWSGILPTIVNNKLMLYAGGFPYVSDRYFVSGFLFLGEFDYYTVFEEVGGAYTYHGLDAMCDGDLNYMSIFVEPHGSGDVGYYAAYGPDVYEEIFMDESEPVGKLRLKRDILNDVYAYYWNNTLSRWEWNGNTSGIFVGNFVGGVRPCFDMRTQDETRLYVDDFVVLNGCNNKSVQPYVG